MILRKLKPYFSKRQYGGGSVMVWRAFAANGTLRFFSNTYKSDCGKVSGYAG